MALVQTENRAGKPVFWGDTAIIPIEKSVRAQPPGMWGVFCWHKPSAVVVKHPDGVNEIIEIQDPTQQAVLSLLGFGLIGSLLIWLIGKKFRK